MNRKLLFAVVSVVLVGAASAQVRVFQADQPAQAADINMNFLVVAPPGMVTIWAGTGNTPPNGWLFCDGTSFSGTTYPNLQTALGGTTLPDLRGRVVVGLDPGSARITDGTANAVGEVGGVDRNSEVPVHTHAITADPGHIHPMRAACGGSCGNASDGFARGNGPLDSSAFATNFAGGHNHGGVTLPAGVNSVTNLQPYATYRYIIKY
jgi:microcystin-dependent protein